MTLRSSVTVEIDAFVAQRAPDRSEPLEREKSRIELFVHSSARLSVLPM